MKIKGLSIFLATSLFEKSFWKIWHVFVTVIFPRQVQNSKNNSHITASIIFVFVFCKCRNRYILILALGNSIWKLICVQKNSMFLDFSYSQFSILQLLWRFLFSNCSHLIIRCTSFFTISYEVLILLSIITLRKFFILPHGGFLCIYSCNEYTMG